MVFKAVLLCASALLVQTISGQYCGCSLGSSIGSKSLYNSNSLYNSKSLVKSNSLVNSNSLFNSNLALSSGGDFLVTSVGPIVPTGISVVSNVDLAGNVDICGTMPYLSAVKFQADLPTSGSGNVDYSCGSGCVGINSVMGSGVQNGLGGSLNGLGGCGRIC